MGWRCLIVMIVINGVVFSQNNEIEIVKENRQNKLEVIVAPNPSEGDVIIKVPTGATCMLLSIQGKIIGKWTVHNGEIQFENLAAGTYWVIVNYEGMVQRKKLVVL